MRIAIALVVASVLITGCSSRGTPSTLKTYSSTPFKFSISYDSAAFSQHVTTSSPPGALTLRLIGAQGDEAGVVATSVPLHDARRQPTGWGHSASELRKLASRLFPARAGFKVRSRWVTYSGLRGAELEWQNAPNRGITYVLYNGNVNYLLYSTAALARWREVAPRLSEVTRSFTPHP